MSHQKKRARRGGTGGRPRHELPEPRTDGPSDEAIIAALILLDKAAARLQARRLAEAEGQGVAVGEAG